MGCKVLIVGGPGNIGESTMIDLVNRNFEVGLFSRTKNLEIDSKVKVYKGDRSETDELRAAFEDFKPDVLIDFIFYTPQEAQQMIDIAYGKVRQFIFISTVDVYGYPLYKFNISEGDMLNPPVSQYAKDKRVCEELFLSKFDGEKFLVTIVRPLYSLGRFVLSTFSRDGGVNLIQRIRDGRPVVVPGDGTTVMQPGDARDTGRMIAKLVNQNKAIGKIYNCGSNEIITQDQYVKIIGEVAGREPNIVHIPTDLMLSLENDEIKEGLLPELTRFNLSYSLDNFLNDFPDFTYNYTLQDGIQRFIEYHEKKGAFENKQNETLEDKILSLWSQLKEGFKL